MARPQKAAAVTHRYDLIGTSDVFTATILLFVNAHATFESKPSFKFDSTETFSPRLPTLWLNI